MMLLYLTSNDNMNLLDFVESENGIVPKKLIGCFSLMQFIKRDVRNFSGLKFFVVDCKAVSDSDTSFLDAIRSFQVMQNARVIIICEGINNSLASELVAIGVTDIVTAGEIDDIKAEIRECLSETGMNRYKPVLPSITTVPQKAMPANEQYEFDCENIRVAIAGAQRRVGVTTTAINLVNWINTHGGAACYLESNANRHLSYIIHSFDVIENGNAYSIDGMDYYLTDEITRKYNFIVIDCGELNTQELQSAFIDADVRVLCGSAMPYEVGVFKKAVELCSELGVFTLGMCVPEDVRQICQSGIADNMVFADCSHYLMDGDANGHVNIKLVTPYMFDLSKLA